MTSENPYKIAGFNGMVFNQSGDLPDSDLLWWGVTRGSLAFAAIGESPHRAIQSVAEVLTTTTTDFESVPFFVEEYPEQAQNELTLRYGERKAVRLLAFSLIEWPDDITNLSSEQRAHGMKHGWLDGL